MHTTWALLCAVWGPAVPEPTALPKVVTFLVLFVIKIVWRNSFPENDSVFILYSDVILVLNVLCVKNILCFHINVRWSSEVLQSVDHE